MAGTIETIFTKEMESNLYFPGVYAVVRKENEDKGLAFLVRDNLMFQEILVDTGPFR